jgi:carbon-monoxide dehydrogenase medium subunit
VVGNLVSGQPAGDTNIPLLALDAEVTIASSEGYRVVPLTEFFLDIGKTVLDPGKEILTQIRFKALGAGQGGSYLRLSKRKALTLPMLVCAVKVTLNQNKDTISEAAIALGPMGPTPFRAQNTEEALKGVPINRQTIAAAAESTAVVCLPRDSLLRGSCDYRQEMAKVFVRRGLSQALEQAGFPHLLEP